MSGGMPDDILDHLIKHYTRGGLGRHGEYLRYALNELKELRARHTLDQSLIALKDERIAELERQLKEFDPDPVVCGCREVMCPHTPLRKASRQDLVDHFRARIRALSNGEQG
jgi:hypothetical protein